MVYLLLGNGFEEMEAIAPCDILRRGGVEVRFVGIGGGKIIGAHGITVQADMTVQELDFEALSMIVLPGGMSGVKAIRESREAMAAIARAYADGRFVAAICAAPVILAELSITDGRSATCYPGMKQQMGRAHMVNAPVVRDGTLITGRAAGTAVEFGLALLEALQGRKASEKVRAGIVFDH